MVLDEAEMNFIDHFRTQRKADDYLDRKFTNSLINSMDGVLGFWSNLWTHEDLWSNCLAHCLF